MKRAIYIGKSSPESYRLSYGMTGYARRSLVLSVFLPDTPEGQQVLIYNPRRRDIYIPSEDQQRHCPKP